MSTLAAYLLWWPIFVLCSILYFDVSNTRVLSANRIRGDGSFESLTNKIPIAIVHGAVVGTKHVRYTIYYKQI